MNKYKQFSKIKEEGHWTKSRLRKKSWVRSCLKKKSYNNEDHALQAIAKMNQYFHEESRAYYCNKCTKFHLTTKPLKVDKVLDENLKESEEVLDPDYLDSIWSSYG